MADHETLVGLARQQSFQASIDLHRCLWVHVVSDEDPDFWVSSVIITLVLDCVGSVVSVDDTSVWRGRHVWHTIVCRCFHVRAWATGLTHAFEFCAITRPVHFVECWVVNFKAVGTNRCDIWDRANLCWSFGGLICQIPLAHDVKNIEVNGRRIVASVLRWSRALHLLQAHHLERHTSASLFIDRHCGDARNVASLCKCTCNQACDCEGRPHSNQK